ncbi:hypothetical protein L7F22_052136 [Adiantum nelumboides]|nr:hypothetical protein [Adiantum nelumboides]
MSNALKLIEGDDKIADMKIVVESIERNINLLESKLSCSLHYMSFFENMMKQLANGCTLLLSPAFYAPEEGCTNRANFYSDCVACGEPLLATNAIGVYMLPCGHKYHRWSDAEVAHHMSFETGHGEKAVGVEEGNVFYLGIASPGGAEKSWSDRKAAKNVGHDTVPPESTVLGATSKEDVEAVLGGNTDAESVLLVEFVKKFKSNKRTTTTTAPGEALAGKKVTCANNASYPIKSIGKILITISDGSDLCLPDVLYVPGIKKNLLSVSSLAKNGLQVIFEDDRYIVRDRENGYSLITTGTLENGLFVLDRYEKQIQACIAETKTQAMQDAELWHARFGHVGYGSLMTLQRHNMVHDLSLLEMPPRHVCEGCVLGKMHRFAFSQDGSIRAIRKVAACTQ